MQLFEGMRPLLEDLFKKHLLAIATGKSRRGLDRDLEFHQLKPLFMASRCADETNPKPHPAMLLELMGELDVSPEQAVMIIKGLREHYEEYHGVKITDEAIEAAVSLSERYITDRFLPDKAIDLVDEAASCVKVAATSDVDSKKHKSLEDELEKAKKRKQRAVTNENFIEALELKAKEQR